MTNFIDDVVESIMYKVASTAWKRNDPTGTLGKRTPNTPEAIAAGRKNVAAGKHNLDAENIQPGSSNPAAQEKYNNSMRTKEQDYEKRKGDYTLTHIDPRDGRSYGEENPMWFEKNTKKPIYTSMPDRYQSSMSRNNPEKLRYQQHNPAGRASSEVPLGFETRYGDFDRAIASMREPQPSYEDIMGVMRNPEAVAATSPAKSQLMGKLLGALRLA